MEPKCEYCGAKSVRTIPVSGAPVYACGAYGSPGKQDGARSYTCRINQIAQLAAENTKLKARVAQLEHQAECCWYETASGQWAVDHCEECRTLDEAVKAAESPGRES